MASSTRLECTNNILVIKGKVSLYTTNSLLTEFQEQFKSDIKEIDCSQIEKADSATISFLIACLRYAKKQNRELNISGMGERLLKLASLYGVEQLFKNHANSSS
jgi:ABC-type transporter Mla MlaB component